MLKKILLMLICVLMFSSAVYAEGPVRKLSRGVSNLAFGMFEIPKQMEKSWEEDSNMIGFGVGFIKGVGHFVYREAVGILEIVTFPFETTEDFAPIIEPEFIFDEEEELEIE